MRDIRRKIIGDVALEAAFHTQLSLAGRVWSERQRQRVPKVYSLHAPAVECIGKGQAAQAIRVRRKGQRLHASVGKKRIRS